MAEFVRKMWKEIIHSSKFTDLKSYFLPLELSNDIQTKNGPKY